MLLYYCLLLLLLNITVSTGISNITNSINYFDGEILQENQFHFISDNKNLCGAIVPGLHRLTRGIDITQLDLLHDYRLDTKDGFMPCAFIEWTCKKKRKLNVHGVDYDVPDQILSIDVLTKESLVIDTNHINNLEKAKNILRKQVGLLTSSKGDFSYSVSYRLYRDLLINTTEMLTVFTALTTSSTINLAPRASLRKSISEFMQDFISEELPDKYENDPTKYMEFISNYGTHYFKTGIYGGIFHYISSFNDHNIREDMTQQQILYNIQLYQQNLASRKGVKTIEKHEFKIPKDKIHTRQSYYGGDAFLLEIDRYESWLPTIAKNPWLIGGTIAPITDLIKDDNIKSQLAKAIDIYIKLAYINDSYEIIDNYIKKHPNKTNKLSSIISKIQLLKSNIKPLKDEVDDIIKELDSVKFLVKFYVASKH